MTETIEARVQHVFQASPEQVFDAWINPVSIRRWLSAALRTMGLPGDILEVRVEPWHGGVFHFSDQRDGLVARHWGSYLRFERPRLLAFTWITEEAEEANPSIVTIQIEARADGCTATLIHTMDAAWKDYLPRVELGWSNMLHALADLDQG